MSTIEHFPPNGSVWLIGDHYHGWMAFETTPALDNDPEHQPSHLPKSRQPKFYYAPGGAWYVKKFFDRAWTDHPDQGAKVTLACAPGKIRGHVFDVPQPFALGTPTVSFTLDRFRQQPDSHPDDKVYRIKSHHGYCSALQSLNLERAAIALRSKLLRGRDQLKRRAEKPQTTAEALHEKAKDIDLLEAHCNQAGFDYFNAFRELIGKQIGPRVLVIDDMDMGFRDYKGFATNTNKASGWGAMLKRVFVNDPSRNNIIVLLGRSLPALDKGGLWKQLTASHSKQTIIIVNADLLRFTGANMSRRTSWERTAQDCLEALEDPRDKKLQPFSAFAHVIVRFGVAGAIHCYRHGKSRRRSADLFYDSKTHGGSFRDVEEEGGVVGNNSIFAACITRELLKVSGKNAVHRAIDFGIRAAIPTCQRLFREGFGPVLIPVELGSLSSWSDPPKDLFHEKHFSPAVHKGHNPTHPTLIHKIAVPHKRARDSWNIVLEDVKTEKERLDVARDIVLYGLGRVLNGPWAKPRRLFAPISLFGRLETVDRDEIEGFRAVSNIIREYLKSVRKDPLAGPMSIAVFGPPGSGKSYTVREIVKAIDPAVEEMFFEINLAQLTSTRELASNLLRIRDAVSPKKTPLVFFDEFDCRHDDEDFGWLKYFLAPMEGGTFKHPEEGVFRLERGIFVFAGGVTHRYSEFSELKQAAGQPKQKGDAQFARAKGPDFISRLRGYIDIKGINSVKGPEKSGDALFMLRRAIILRSVLERNGFVSEPDKVAQIDVSLLDALLVLRGNDKRKGFEYDTRSMRMVVNMCLRLHGRLEKASLPPTALLDMHVDSNQLVREMASRPDPKDRSDDNTIFS
jgi:hypothetical protein